MTRSPAPSHARKLVALAVLVLVLLLFPRRAASVRPVRSAPVPDPD